MALIALACFGILLLLWDEIPSWRPGGIQTVAAASVSFQGEAPECASADPYIAIFGDSHVEGSRMGSPGEPFGTVLQGALGGDAKVELYGIGGEKAEEGERRWRSSDTAAEIIMIGYGTNDSAPRGWLSDKIPVPLTDFKASLTRQVRHWQAKGRQVYLIAPPPLGTTAMMQRLSPYRNAVKEVGEGLAVSVLDPADAFAQCPDQQPLLAIDAVHMKPAGHQCLGEWMAQQLCPKPS